MFFFSSLGWMESMWCSAKLWRASTSSRRLKSTALRVVHPKPRLSSLTAENLSSVAPVSPQTQTNPPTTTTRFDLKHDIHLLRSVSGNAVSRLKMSPYCVDICCVIFCTFSIENEFCFHKLKSWHGDCVNKTTWKLDLRMSGGFLLGSVTFCLDLCAKVNSPLWLTHFVL